MFHEVAYKGEMFALGEEALSRVGESHFKDALKDAYLGLRAVMDNGVPFSEEEKKTFDNIESAYIAYVLED